MKKFYRFLRSPILEPAIRIFFSASAFVKDDFDSLNPVRKLYDADGEWSFSSDGLTQITRDAPVGAVLYYPSSQDLINYRVDIRFRLLGSGNNVIVSFCNFFLQKLDIKNQNKDSDINFSTISLLRYGGCICAYDLSSNGLNAWTTRICGC